MEAIPTGYPIPARYPKLECYEESKNSFLETWKFFKTGDTHRIPDTRQILLGYSKLESYEQIKNSILETWTSPQLGSDIYQPPVTSKRPQNDINATSKQPES